ncbi:MAG: hypothetical protein DRQ44_11645 [Gammaproteobacteria bacterium]|nr:MAG: hypothetical protein DRQ44_11645 [Gammaproteobacteria bacterium]
MPSLFQVCIWDHAFQEIEMIGQLDITGSPNVYFTTECTSRIVSIPDSAFLNALIDEGVDTNEDKRISYGEAYAVTTLDVGFHDGDFINSSIFDLSGIEAFKNLDTLDISCHPVQNLVLWNQTNLKYLAATGCKLEHIDVRFCTELRTLDLTYYSNRDPGGKGNLIEIDVSRNRYLSKLTCNNNQIKNLDVSNNTELEYLSCSANLLASLNISENALLNTLRCSNNRLNSLDVSTNSELEYLSCSGNNLTSIDVSNNTILSKLNCSDNQLTGLNLSNNTNLESLYCNTNGLRSLDVSDNRLLHYLGISHNPDLREVCVWTFPFPPLDVAIDTTGSPNVEFYDCSGTGIGINKKTIPDLQVFPNPTQNYLTIETNHSDHYLIEITTLNGQSILTGKMEGTSHQIDLSSFQKGIYFITISSIDFVATRKIIKLE